MHALRMDAHALAGLSSCKIQSFDGYIQSGDQAARMDGAIRCVAALK